MNTLKIQKILPNFIRIYKLYIYFFSPVIADNCIKETSLNLFFSKYLSKYSIQFFFSALCILFLTRMFSIVSLVHLYKVLSQICHIYTEYCKTIVCTFPRAPQTLYSLLYYYATSFQGTILEYDQMSFKIGCKRQSIRLHSINVGDSNLGLAICACLQTIAWNRIV